MKTTAVVVFLVAAGVFGGGCANHSPMTPPSADFRRAGLADEAQAATGVSPGYVRLSVGIEHIDDILADLDQALGSLKAAAAAE